MTTKAKASYYWAAALAVAAAFFSYLGHWIESDFGRLSVETVRFMTVENVPMVGKLYRPKSATKDHPAAGLLALHGYQSDKEATNTFGALELARRGFVVLAIDQFGHGFSTAAPASNKNMSGADNGYLYLQSLPFVDKTRLGIFGHSTGALNALRVAKLHPDHRAVNGLSGKGGTLTGLHNYLLTQGLYEEIGGYREKTFPVKDLIHNKTRLAAVGLPPDGTLQWQHTYGNFADGSARRVDLVNGTHLGVMISRASNQSAIDWFSKALQQPNHVTGFIYWYKEWTGLIALLLALAAALFLARGLLRQPYFAAARQAIYPQSALDTRSWRRFALLNIASTALLYPLLTQWGGANEPIAAHVAWLPLEMGNGIITWLLGSAVVSGLFFWRWQKKHPLVLQNYGVVASPRAGIRTRAVIARSLLLAALLVVALYAFAAWVHDLWGQELRFLWPLLKPLTPERWALFPVYWLPIVLFFFVFNGLILSVQMRPACAGSFCATWLQWSGKAIFVAVGGLVLLWCFHFLPDLMQIGPGFDVVGLPQFGGRWMMMLPVIMAQFCAFIVLNYWCYLQTGYVWFGVFFTSLLMTWTLVGGQVIGRFLA